MAFTLYITECYVFMSNVMIPCIYHYGLKHWILYAHPWTGSSLILKKFRCYTGVKQIHVPMVTHRQGTNFCEIWIQRHTFTTNTVQLKMLSAKWRPFCSGNGTSWWRHQMETYSALLALCEGNSPATIKIENYGEEMQVDNIYREVIVGHVGVTVNTGTSDIVLATINTIVHGECGMLPLSIQCTISVLHFINRLHLMADNTIVKRYMTNLRGYIPWVPHGSHEWENWSLNTI